MSGAAFNGDESRILTWSDDNTARLWDVATGKEVVAPLRHEDGVRGAAFNGDESRILTWSADNTARLWDAATGKEVVAPLRHEDRRVGRRVQRRREPHPDLVRGRHRPAVGRGDRPGGRGAAAPRGRRCRAPRSTATRAAS